MSPKVRFGRRAAVALAVCASIAVLAACAPRRTDAASAKPTKPSGDIDSLPQMVAPPANAPSAQHTASLIEVSPLSRVQRRNGKPALIEVRIDATDPTGVAARLGGSMRVVVRAPGAVPESLAFDLPMRTQKEADQRYDPTLRQYVLRVEPDWSTQPAAGSAIDVTATLTLASGAALEAAGVIEW